MSDENNSGAAAPEAQNPGQNAAQPAVRLQILTQYIRDLSFENAVAQKGLPSGEVQPEISVQVSLDARKRPAEHQYEVISKFRVQSSNATDKSPLFLCELDYGGIFHVEGVPEDQLHPFLMIECPRMMFPFVRRIVSDMTRDGGFPPFNMDPVDFVALYRQEIARRTQAQRPADQPLS
ncbi:MULTISPECIES: protein-export chaperone SecB [Paracoccus]|jgi:preprotein translocase subunit SecB|uniref:Protein-export protein SecB n=1 Tax=Paracoccus denitrificans (strain Pd 1222) TaxID=318586 RepID=SECB_PARDP|nr:MULTISPECIES: protein-export chaperone SecB [Paracoccus]A1B5S4.1 RecName: Full=Protein-export protein SecB [Paracoccus denitrificans PD1222]ABL70868.1 protein translocase subunit secB [Paracoccus denitrificans PD1222]MBB4627668.1 preprotein translocase subunit SecB [Paracoccus denitrificans]MCU7428980.1 protein-export chaperone SecB [Paracoccus denitrificans]QAR26187.1 protein-export chaperone SecB [Paracoccus denitrificans]UPV95103.1 protein-export chaperone SecB [Paracoccus denitrificans